MSTEPQQSRPNPQEPEKSEPEQRGVVFPAAADGRRSTSALGRAVVADALRPVDVAGALDAEQETSWRSGYLVHFRRLLEAGLSSRDTALAVANGGLGSLHQRMRAVGGRAGPGLERLLLALGVDRPHPLVQRAEAAVRDRQRGVAGRQASLQQPPEVHQVARAPARLLLRVEGACHVHRAQRVGDDARIGLVSMGGAGFSAGFDYVEVSSLGR